MCAYGSTSGLIGWIDRAWNFSVDGYH